MFFFFFFFLGMGEIEIGASARVYCYGDRRSVSDGSSSMGFSSYVSYTPPMKCVGASAANSTGVMQ
jgi:hypothetical protein